MVFTPPASKRNEKQAGTTSCSASLLQLCITGSSLPGKTPLIWSIINTAFPICVTHAHTYATCAGLGPVFVKKGNFCRCGPHKWAGPSGFLRNHSRRIDRSHSHNVLGLKTLKPQYNGTSVCDRVCALTPEAVRPPAPPVAQV